MKPGKSEAGAFLMYAACAALCAATAPYAGRIVCAGGCVLLAAARWRNGALMAPLFGFCVPLLGCMGEGTLLACAFCFLALRRRCEDAQPPRALPFGPFLLLPFAWSVGLAYAQLAAPGSSVTGGALLRAWGDYPPEWLAAVVMSMRWACIALLWRALTPQEARGILRGLGAGTAVSLAAIGAQAAGLLPHALHGTADPFWVSLGRFAGTYSDPNAAGIFLALAAPLLVPAWGSSGRRAAGAGALAVVLLLGVGACTGSRSLFLGLALWFILTAYAVRPKLLFAAVVCVACVWAVLRLNGGAWVDHSALPGAAKRLVHTLSGEAGNDSFFSRWAFLKIAYDVWSDAPFLGVGFERFRGYVAPYASARGLGIGAWSDNANNFYAQVLSELGMIGAVLALLSLGQLRRGEIGALPAAARTSAIMLCVLFLVGPHIVFDQVAVLTGVILACALRLEEQPSVWRRSAWWIACPAALVVMLRGAAADFGLYGWERDNVGFFRWSGPAARVELPCSAQGRSALNLRFAGATPQKAFISTAYERHTVSGIPGEGVRVDLNCAPERAQRAGGCEGQLLRVRFSVDPSWSPRRSGLGNDPRELGVQLRGAELGDEIKKLRRMCNTRR